MGPRLIARRPVVLLTGFALAAGVFAGGLAVGRMSVVPRHGSVPGPAQLALDEAMATIRSDAAHPVSTATLERAAIDGMLASLNDRWAGYYPATDGEDLRAVLTGDYSGLGLWLAQRSGRVFLTSVTPASPAALAGLVAGERIVAVDGVRVRGDSAAAVAARLDGPVGSAVQVRLASATDPGWTVTLRRALIADGNVAMRWVAPGVGEIEVRAFSRGVGGQVWADLASLRRAGLRAVVLDLRNDPGGLLDEAVRVASAFLDGGEVVSYSGRHLPRVVLDATGHGDTTTPMAVLVNGGTASAAEVVAGALQDRGRAVIVGSRTFGKGSIQEPFALAGGGLMELTVGTYRTPDGTDINGRGITPDVVVSGSAGPTAPLTAAVAVLTALVADANLGAPAGRA